MCELWYSPSPESILAEVSEDANRLLGAKFFDFQSLWVSPSFGKRGRGGKIDDVDFLADLNRRGAFSTPWL